MIASYFPKLRRGILAANPWVPEWMEYRMKRAADGTIGYANAEKIVLCSYACTPPGRGYSWPGSVSDRTLRGVYLHEVGHVVNYALPKPLLAAYMLRLLGGPRI